MDTRDKSWGRWALPWEAEQQCLPREGVEKGAVRGRGRAGIRSHAGEGITKCLPLWRNRLEMISHCSCFDSPNALARTISQSR